ncbi:hypothetical protein Bca52824_065623 [Brassica carinata]|uniref:Uncharacterized protein n=1 Tax=Brassica carinata TaxID=52824 RepID=A0A8X7QNU7_BRACI|nr:hypothetical protein Bca52824_065623 [Brassica carinata]
MVKGTITTMVTRLFPWSSTRIARARQLNQVQYFAFLAHLFFHYVIVFRARETETWRIVALKKVGFDKFELESVYMAKDFVIHFKNNLKKDCDS